MPISALCDKSEIESFDITAKVRYKGDKLDKSDLKKLYGIIIELGKSLNVPKELLDRTKIAIDKDRCFSAVPLTSTINISELAALILLEKQSFQNYIHENNYDLDIYKAYSEKNIKFFKEKMSFIRRCFITTKYEALVSKSITSDEIKASIAHEFGHLVDKNAFQQQRRLLENYLLMLLMMISVPSLLLTKKLKEKYDVKQLDIDTITSSIHLLSSIIFCTFIFGLFIKARLFRSSEIFADKFAAQDNILSKAASNKHQRRANYVETLPCPEYQMQRLLSRFLDEHPDNAERALFFQNASKKA